MNTIKIITGFDEKTTIDPITLPKIYVHDPLIQAMNLVRGTIVFIENEYYCVF